MKEPSFLKYPEIPHLAEALEILDSDNLQVFEKLDGGNTQLRVFNGRIYSGSRANFLKRQEMFRFEWFKSFNRWAMSNVSLYNLPDNLIVYGEFTSPHTIRYKPEFTNKFFLIDVYDTLQRRFIPYNEARDQVETRLKLEEIDFLEPLAEGHLELDDVKRLAVDESEYSLYGREGVVIKDYQKQKFAKLWRTSADKSKENLLEEIIKTIRSMEVTRDLPGEISESYGEFKKTELPQRVYEELLRSGRMNISLAEIAKAVERVTNKI